MKSEATILGHAIHPMLVTLPLGALPTALVFDVLYVWQGNPAWFLGGFVATVVGVAGIAAAAVPGFIDYRSVVPDRGEVRKHATIHLWLGVTLLVVFLASAVLRWLALPAPDAAAAWTVLGLSVLGVLGLVVQGYIGGGLVEEHQIGVHTAPPGHARGAHGAPPVGSEGDEG